MKVLFVGTGEAFDDKLPNTSILVESGGTVVLVDCGFSAAQALWSSVRNPDAIDALYVTHLHADHCFGIPALIVRLNADGRTKPLVLLGSKMKFEHILATVESAYPGLMPKLGFKLTHLAVPEGGSTTWRDIAITTALTVHAAPNHAVRFDFPAGRSLMVSGDGEVTPESAAMFAGCTVVSHEAYRMTEHMPGHSSVRQVLETAAAAVPPPRMVALVHCAREEDRCRFHEFEVPFVVPGPGTLLSF